MKSLGQIAYEAFTKGAKVLPYSNLSPEMKSAWEKVLGLDSVPEVDTRTFERRRRDNAVSKLKLLSRVMSALREDTAGSNVLSPEETAALDSAYAQIGRIV